MRCVEAAGAHGRGRRGSRRGVLRSGGLVCPFCTGFGGWGFARPRRCATAEGPVRLRPRRAVCTGCGRTQVLLPVIALSRRADVAEVIGAGLMGRPPGWGIAGSRWVGRGGGDGAGVAAPVRRAGRVDPGRVHGTGRGC